MPKDTGLQKKFLRIFVAAYLLVALATMAVLFRAVDGIAGRLGEDFALQYVKKERADLWAPIRQELTLALKMADTPTIRRWVRSEADGTLREEALAELESYKNHFRDGSYFLIIHNSRNYYYNDREDRYRGAELRYTLEPQKESDAWYFSTIAAVRDFALNVNYDAELRETKIWMNVILREGNEVLGLVGTGLSLESFIRDFVADADEGIVPVLMDGTGAIQAHPEEALIDRSSITKGEKDKSTLFRLLKTEEDRRELRSAMDRLRRGEADAVALHAGTADGERILALSRIPDIDWYAAVVFDHRTVIRPERFLPMAAGALLSLLGLAAILLFFLRRIVLAPIGELTRSTQAFAAGKTTAALPVRSGDEIGTLTAAFNSMTAEIRAYTEGLEGEVRRRTSDLRMLLDHTGEGILSFGPDLAVGGDYSSECDEFFGPEVEGRPIDELLFPSGGPAADLFRRAAEKAFSAGSDFKRELYLSLAPAECSTGGRTLSIRARALGPERIMLVLADITVRRELEAKVTEERRLLRFVVNALANRRVFHEVTEGFSRLLEDGPALPAEEAYRQVHTYKGLLMQLDFPTLPGLLHRCEEKLAALRADHGAGIPDLEELARAFERDREVLARYLGTAFFAREEPYTLEPADLAALELLAAKIRGAPDAVRDLKLERELEVIRRLGTVPVFDLLASFPAHTVELAELRGKKIRPFSPSGENLRVRRDRYEGLALSLVHLFRNTAVHGIEDPETRLAAGKDECGRVSLEVAYADGRLTIRIADDGAGVDFPALRAAAKGEDLDEAALTELLFRGGLSSLDGADLHGGRGMGLSAVAAEADRLGGGITVRSTPGLGTAFTISIPDAEVYA